MKRQKASHLAYVSSVVDRSNTPDSGFFVSASSDIGTENERFVSDFVFLHVLFAAGDEQSLCG